MNISKLLADSRNYTKNRKQKIEYIVIHYTANNGDTALNNCKYFKNDYRGASAHYFVDEYSIWQSVEDKDTAWHCGTKGKYYHNKCRNENAIGVEMCSKKDSKGEYYIKQEVINNTLELVKMLMKKYNIPASNVLRHYDITRKNCPAPFVKHNQSWINFKNRLNENEKKEDTYMKVKREYKYGENVKTFEVINDKGENYIKIRDLVELLGKEVDYDNNTKITTVK